MSSETRKILEMLADKKNHNGRSRHVTGETFGPTASGCEAGASGRVQTPLHANRGGRAGRKTGSTLACPWHSGELEAISRAILPLRVRGKRAEQGINIAKTGALNPEEWATAIESMNIDVKEETENR
jgi:hypothetical protein